MLGMVVVEQLLFNMEIIEPHIETLFKTRKKPRAKRIDLEESSVSKQRTMDEVDNNINNNGNNNYGTPCHSRPRHLAHLSRKIQAQALVYIICNKCHNM